MPTHSILGASRSLSPPQPFANSHDETRFQREYIQTGYSFAIAGSLLGMLISIAFIVASRGDLIVGSDSLALQLLPTIIGVSCGLSFFSLLLDRDRSLSNYQLTILVPAAIALFGLGSTLPLTSTDQFPVSIASWATMLFVLTLWIVSAFCRLPAKQIIAMTISASALHLFGVLSQFSTGWAFHALVLFVANVVVWALVSQIEKRERLIWYQAGRSLTAIRQANSKSLSAQSVNKAQLRLIRSIGHDIQQPLSSGGIYLGMVSQAAHDAANQTMEKNLDRVRTCLRSVEGSLERLLEDPDQAHSQLLQTSRIDLTDVFADLCDVFNPQADQLGVSLDFSRACQQSTIVRTNERAIREVLSNLLTNALKYSSIVSQRTPRVVVDVVSLPHSVRVDILDNGVGIPHELQTRVFDEYYRAPSVTGSVRGSGLGLAIVETTVQRLPDHRLRLQSKVSQGTRVKVYLPPA